MNANPIVHLALIACSIAPALAVAQEAKAPKGQELQVFLGDKPVGGEMLRSTKGGEAHFHAGEGQLQDKIGKKAWKAFKQRWALQLGLDGAVTQYDRWIDVTGATQQVKLFNYQGQWKISVVDAAFEGKKPKPKVSDIAGGQPLVVLDERAPALVAVAVELAGAAKECHFVRVDNATSGKANLVHEALVDAKGSKFKRTRLQGQGLDVAVLRDAAGKIVQIQGIDGWRAQAKDVKLPTGLVADAGAAPEAKADTPPAQPGPSDPAQVGPAKAAPAKGAAKSDGAAKPEGAAKSEGAPSGPPAAAPAPGSPKP
jgi:hypothetical protein